MGRSVAGSTNDITARRVERISSGTSLVAPAPAPAVVLHVEFERQILKPVFSLDRL
jgi:hypothetical protein